MPQSKIAIDKTLNDVYINVTRHLHATFFNCTVEGLHHREHLMNSTFGNLKTNLDSAVQQMLEKSKYEHFEKDIESAKQEMINKFIKEFAHTE